MTRRLAALTFAALALTVLPAAAHEGAATVDCTTATFTAVGYGPGAHIVGAVLTVTADGVPSLADLEPQTFDGDSGTLSWDVSEHTDRSGLLELDLAVSWDAHGGGTTSATATLVCVEPTTTTTPKSPPTTPKPTTTTTGVPVTAATTAVPTTTTTVVPPAADAGGTDELPRTGSRWAGDLLAIGIATFVGGVIVVTATRRRRERTR